MRAMVFDRYGESEVMSLKEVPVPDPQDSDVLIRVGYAGVNPSDSKTRSGQSARAGYRPRGVDRPFVTGMDAADVVERTGNLHIAQQTLASLLTLVLLFAAWPQSLVAEAQPGPLQVPPAPPYLQLTEVRH